MLQSLLIRGTASLSRPCCRSRFRVEARVSEAPAKILRPAGAFAHRGRVVPVGSMPPGLAPESAEGPEMSGKPARGPGSTGAPRRSSGRADLISGKPRRRKATAPHRSLPQDQPPRRGRRVGQPSFLGGTRRYLPAHLRAPQPTHGSARVRGRAQGGADAGRLPTATASQDQSATSSDTATSGAGGRATASGNDQTFPTCTSLRASPQLTRSGFRGWPGCGAPEPNVASTA